MRFRLPFLLGSALLFGATQAVANPACDDHDRVPIAIPSSITDLRGENRDGYINLGVPPDQTVELHIVGSYEGSGRVHVGPSEKPIVLVLASFLTSLWRLDVDPDAQLKEIVLVGYQEEQRVNNVPDDVEVIRIPGCYDYAHRWRADNHGLQYMEQDYKDFLASVQHLTGLIETSFQGSYSLREEFTVPPNPADYPITADVADPAVSREPPPPKTMEVLAAYEAATAAAPGEVRPTMQILIDLMRAGKFPVLSVESMRGDDPYAPRPWKLPFGGLTGESLRVRDRGDCGEEIPIIIGSEIGDTIKCGWGDQIYATGAGDDVLDEGWGNDLINMGPDDDVAVLSWGFDVVVLEKNWGEDLVSKTCTDSKPSAEESARLNWSWPYFNFIVFGPGVWPAEMVWGSGNVLFHPASGSRLILADKCFNFVFIEEGELPARPGEIPEPERQVVVRPRNGGSECWPFWFFCL